MIRWALVRLYSAVETNDSREWRMQHSGPVVLTYVRTQFFALHHASPERFLQDGTSKHPYVLRVLEMPHGRIVCEQRVTPEMNYRSLQPSFHAWDGPDEVQGMSFAQDSDCPSFLDAVLKAARGGTLQYGILFFFLLLCNVPRSPRTHCSPCSRSCTPTSSKACKESPASGASSR